MIENADVWWSYLLSAMGMTTAYLAGAGRIRAWAFGLMTQVAWAAYAISTGQHGFLVSVAGFSGIYLKHLLVQLRRHQDGPICHCFLPVGRAGAASR